MPLMALVRFNCATAGWWATGQARSRAHMRRESNEGESTCGTVYAAGGVAPHLRYYDGFGADERICFLRDAEVAQSLECICIERSPGAATCEFSAARSAHPRWQALFVAER